MKSTATSIAVIGGGISVLRAVFDLLDIDEMQVAQGALRQGALYDLLDREQQVHPSLDVALLQCQSSSSMVTMECLLIMMIPRCLLR